MLGLGAQTPWVNGLFCFFRVVGIIFSPPPKKKARTTTSFFSVAKKLLPSPPFPSFHKSFSSNSLGDEFLRITGGSLRSEASGESAMGTSCFEQPCMAPDPTTQAFFRWAEMMDVVICRPFFRCKHHNHDFFETYI